MDSGDNISPSHPSPPALDDEDDWTKDVPVFNAGDVKKDKFVFSSDIVIDDDEDVDGDIGTGIEASKQVNLGVNIDHHRPSDRWKSWCTQNVQENVLEVLSSLRQWAHQALIEPVTKSINDADDPLALSLGTSLPTPSELETKLPTPLTFAIIPFVCRVLAAQGKQDIVGAASTDAEALAAFPSTAAAMEVLLLSLLRVTTACGEAAVDHGLTPTLVALACVDSQQTDGVSAACSPAHAPLLSLWAQLLLALLPAVAAPSAVAGNAATLVIDALPSHAAATAGDATGEAKDAAAGQSAALPLPTRPLVCPTQDELLAAPPLAATAQTDTPQPPLAFAAALSAYVAALARSQWQQLRLRVSAAAADAEVEAGDEEGGDGPRKRKRTDEADAVAAEDAKRVRLDDAAPSAGDATAADATIETQDAGAAGATMDAAAVGDAAGAAAGVSLRGILKKASRSGRKRSLTFASTAQLAEVRLFLKTDPAAKASASAGPPGLPPPEDYIGVGMEVDGVWYECKQSVPVTRTASNAAQLHADSLRSTSAARDSHASRALASTQPTTAQSNRTPFSLPPRVAGAAAPAPTAAAAADNESARQRAREATVTAAALTLSLSGAVPDDPLPAPPAEEWGMGADNLAHNAQVARLAVAGGPAQPTVPVPMSVPMPMPVPAAAPAAAPASDASALSLDHVGIDQASLELLTQALFSIPQPATNAFGAQPPAPAPTPVPTPAAPHVHSTGGGLLGPAPTPQTHARPHAPHAPQQPPMHAPQQPPLHVRPQAGHASPHPSAGSLLGPAPAPAPLLPQPPHTHQHPQHAHAHPHAPHPGMSAPPHAPMHGHGHPPHHTHPHQPAQPTPAAPVPAATQVHPQGLLGHAPLPARAAGTGIPRRPAGLPNTSMFPTAGGLRPGVFGQPQQPQQPQQHPPQQQQPPRAGGYHPQQPQGNYPYPQNLPPQQYSAPGGAPPPAYGQQGYRSGPTPRGGHGYNPPQRQYPPNSQGQRYPGFRDMNSNTSNFIHSRRRDELEANTSINAKLRLPPPNNTDNMGPTQRKLPADSYDKPLHRPILHPSSRPTSAATKPTESTHASYLDTQNPTAVDRHTRAHGAVPPSYPTSTMAGVNLARRRPNNNPAVSAVAAGIVPSPSNSTSIASVGSSTSMSRPYAHTPVYPASSSSSSSSYSLFTSAPSVISTTSISKGASPAGARLLARLERLERVGTQLARDEHEERMRDAGLTYSPSAATSAAPRSGDWCESSSDVTAVVQRRSDALVQRVVAQEEAAASSLARVQQLAQRLTGEGGGGGGGDRGDDEDGAMDASAAMGVVLPRAPPKPLAGPSRVPRRGEEYFAPVRSTVGAMGVVAAASVATNTGRRPPYSLGSEVPGKPADSGLGSSFLDVDGDPIDLLAVLGVSGDHDTTTAGAGDSSRLRGPSLHALVAAALTDMAPAPRTATATTLTRHSHTSTGHNGPPHNSTPSATTAPVLSMGTSEAPTASLAPVVGGVRRVPSAGRRAGLSSHAQAGGSSSEPHTHPSAASTQRASLSGSTASPDSDAHALVSVAAGAGAGGHKFVPPLQPGTGSGLAAVDYFSLLSGAPSAQALTHAAAHSLGVVGTPADAPTDYAHVRRRPHPHAAPPTHPPPPPTSTSAATPAPASYSASLSTDLTASMAQRLTVLERLARKQAQQLREADAAARAAADRDARARVAVGCLVRQVLEMEAFLSDYGMQWAGYSAEAELGMPPLDFPTDGSLAAVRARRGENKQRNNGNTTAVAERAGPARPGSAYKPQSVEDGPVPVASLQPDLLRVTATEMRAWAAQVNGALPSSMAVTGVDGVVRMGPPPQVDVLVFANGVAMDGVFLRAGASAWVRAITDLSDGYLPARLIGKYPEGAALQVVDRSADECVPAQHGVEGAVEDAEGTFVLRASARSNGALRVVNGDIVRTQARAPAASRMARLGTGGRVKHSVDGRDSAAADVREAREGEDTEKEKEKKSVGGSHGPPGFVAFTGVGRVLGTGARVAPRDLILAAAAQAAPGKGKTGLHAVADALAATEAIAKQTDALVRQALGLPGKDSEPLRTAQPKTGGSGAKRMLPSTVVCDGNVVHVTKPKELLVNAAQAATDGTQRPPGIDLQRRATNVSCSVLVTGGFKPQYGRLRGDASAGAVATGESQSNASIVDGDPDSAPPEMLMRRQGTTNVAQSRLVHAAVQRTASAARAASPSSKGRHANPFSATGSMFASVSATVGSVTPEKTPPAAKVEEEKAPSPARTGGDALVCVLDAATSAYLALSKAAVAAASKPAAGASTSSTVYVKVTFTDKPTVTTPAPCDAPATPLFLRIAASAPLSQLWLAVKAHRHRMGYSAGPIEGRAPFAGEKIAESGSVSDAGLAGGQVVVRPC